MLRLAVTLLDQFKEDYAALAPDQQAEVRRAIREYIEDAERDGVFRDDLRVHAFVSRMGIYSMSWEHDDGRITFEYGRPLVRRRRDPHLILRRCGTHAIYDDP